MRTAALPLLLTILTTNALATQWEPIAEGASVALEVDVESIRKISEDIFEATFRFTHSSPQISQKSGTTYKSSEVTSFFDCKERKYAPFNRVEVDEIEGKRVQVAIVRIPEPKIQYYVVQPDSMNNVMQESVCVLGNWRAN